MLSDHEIALERNSIADVIAAIKLLERARISPMRGQEIEDALSSLPDTATWELQLCEQKDEA